MSATVPGTLHAVTEGMPSMLGSQLPDTVIDAGTYGPLVVRAATVRGDAHRAEGAPAQDDFGLAVSPDGRWFVAALADGVASSPRAHVAARLCARSGSRHVASLLAQTGPDRVPWDEVVGRMAGQILAQARVDSHDERLDARDAARLMAANVAFAVIATEPTGGAARQCTVVAVGGASVWVLRRGQEWVDLTAGSRTGQAQAGARSAALPMLPGHAVQPVMAGLAPGDALALVCVGVSEALSGGSGDVARHAAARWATPPQRYQFAIQLDTIETSGHEDRSAVVVWNEPAPPAAPSWRSRADLSTLPPPPRSGAESWGHADLQAPTAMRAMGSEAASDPVDDLAGPDEGAVVDDPGVSDAGMGDDRSDDAAMIGGGGVDAPSEADDGSPGFGSSPSIFDQDGDGIPDDRPTRSLGDPDPTDELGLNDDEATEAAEPDRGGDSRPVVPDPLPTLRSAIVPGSDDGWQAPAWNPPSWQPPGSTPL